MATYDGSIIIDTKIDQTGITSGIKNIVGGVGKIGAAAVASVGTATAALTKEGLTSFADFETGMREVFTLLPGISQEAMDEMSAQVQTASVEMGKLPEEVIPALYNSLSAGVPPDNVFEFLKEANESAVGGVTDLDTSVNALSSIVNAYGTDVISTSEVSDLLFTTVKNGKTTLDELASTIYNIAPLASSMGVSFDQVTAAAATMTKQGIPTTQTMTMLKNLMSELSKEGSVADKAFRDIAGMGFTDFIAQGGTVYDAMQLMEAGAAEAGLGVNNLFGSIEAGQAALALTGKGAAMFAEDMAAMEDATGAADEAFATMDQGLQPALNRLAAGVETAKVKLGEALAEPAADIVTGLTGMLTGDPAAADAMAKGLSDLLKTAINAVTGILPSLGSIAVELVNALVTSISDNADDIGDAATQIILALLDALMANLPQIFEIGYTVILSLMNGIVENLPQILSMGVDMILMLLQGLIDTIPQLVEVAVALIPQLVNSIVLLLPRLIETGIELAIALALGIVEAIPQIITALVSAIPQLVSAIIQAAPQLLAAGPKIIIELIKGIIGAVPELLTALFDIGQNIVAGVWDGIKSMAGAFAENIKEFFGGIVDGAKKVLGIASPAKSMISVAHDTVAGVQVGWEDKAPDFLADVEQTFDAVAEIGKTTDFRVSGKVLHEGVTDEGDMVGTVETTYDEIVDQINRERRDT